MLRITQSVSAAGVQRYFDEELQLGDYYVKGEQLTGQWYGRGAAVLGLEGDVTRDQFHALTENRHPFTGDQLSQRNDVRRTVGYDWTFSAKKSVSVLHAYTQDPRILTAFRESVRETMAEVEQNIETRVRIGGQNHDRKTGNMLWSEFVHFTSRPIDGVADPHLHCHAYVQNLTVDLHEGGRWKSAQFRGLKRDAPFYEALFDARLAKKLEDIGYVTERQGKGWEIAGLERETVEKFSRRTVAIETEAQKQGITAAKHKEKLGAKTRDKKTSEIGKGHSRHVFLERLTTDEKRMLDRIAAGKVDKKDPPPTAGDAVGFALDHSFERKSVVSEKRVLAEALKFGVGKLEVEAVKTAWQNRDDVLKREDGGQTMTTTRAVLEEEKAMIQFARDGRTTRAPLVQNLTVENPELGDEQREALSKILGSTDRVIGLRGGAGTGKTWLTKEAVAQIEATNKTVTMLAPSSAASRGVLRDEGFDKADTVAKFLNTRELQDATKNGVLWIDEAGLLGAKTMNRVFDVAKAQNARVVLAGDTRQHTAVERGDALRTLETHGGLEPATLTTIHRQKTSWYRRVVDQIQKGQHRKGFENLVDKGAVKEIAGRDERLAALAGDYVAAARERKSVLVVAPTHVEGDAVTAAIRSRLKTEGLLKGKPRSFTTQQDLSFTDAQKTDPTNYAKGQVVQFVQNAKGIRRGQRFTVDGRDRTGNVTLVDAEGQRRALPLETPKRFTVYRTRETEIAVGDSIRVTQNGFAKDRYRLNNGTLHTVAGFTREGDIVLANRKRSVIDKGFANFTHGHVVTSHTAQGATVDRVLIAQSTESFPASSAEQFYVSASRGRENITVFTDDAEGLRAAITKSGHRMAAVELAPDIKQDTRSVHRHASLVQRLKTYARTVAERTIDTTHALIQKHVRHQARQPSRGLEPDFR